MRPLFSGQLELSNLDCYFQDGGKTGAQTNQSFWKLNDIFWWSKVSHIIIKGWNFMIKPFSGQVVFCFAILRAISAYVGENWLSQYITFEQLVNRCIRTVGSELSVYQIMGSQYTKNSFEYASALRTINLCLGSVYRYRPVSLDYDSRGTVPYL